MIDLESDHIQYNFSDSIQRLNEIISRSESDFKELDRIPARSELSFSNGFYVSCSALFVDIRYSSELTDIHKPRVLAKLYRAYISEVVAIMNGNPSCSEINVIGDGILGVFDTPDKSDIDGVFSTAARISSIVDILNYYYKKNGMEEITVGMGMSWGKALMVKAGYKGSGINDVIWMGEVVNDAFKLADYGNREKDDSEMMVSNVFHHNLNEDKKKLLERNAKRDCYHGDVVNGEMDKWYRTNCR